MKLFLKRLYLIIFNKKNHVTLKSTAASIHAQYRQGVLIDYNTIVSEDVTIGEYSYVNKNSSIENCTIGKFCSISSGVYICPYEHDLEAFSTHPMFERKVRAKRAKVIIGNDVLISLNCIILSGVKIGDGAVVAAGAVVTKDVRPYEIVGGVPAKHIGWRYSPVNIEETRISDIWKRNSDELLSMKAELARPIQEITIEKLEK